MFNRHSIKKCGNGMNFKLEPQSGGEGFNSLFLQLIIPKPFNLG